MRKIVVITGSPRRNGNSTAMAEAFIQAAKDQGHMVTRFDAAFMRIGICNACEACFQTGKACCFDDDFNNLAPAILEADVVVFSTPVYWYAVPAPLKAVLDKMYSFVVADRKVAGKDCILLGCCEENDRSVLDGIRTPFERSAAFLKWRMAGEVLIPGVWLAGDIHKTDGCARAAALAREL